ncbi:UDP-galactose transporter [Colletotrichum cuscutae]|uniref:UDP-galactose transporter n=1 Tax=Colletotrichum cuscutae TaxID=1209917 RepID=A0AAI9V8Z2_9PEZI|nr:UDP-galactose transporter [Colletotrichum cuscutae]
MNHGLPSQQHERVGPRYVPELPQLSDSGPGAVNAVGKVATSIQMKNSRMATITVENAQDHRVFEETEDTGAMAPNNFARRRYARITAGVVLAMSRPQDNSARYEPLSAVVLSEALKLFISLGGAAWAYNNTEDRSAVASGFLDYVRSGHDNTAIPAFLYCIKREVLTVG